MKIEIAPGCSVMLSSAEQVIMGRLKHLRRLDQSELSDDELVLITRLVSKNLIKRSNQSGQVSYEIRSGIHW